jgi:hypothetical protein
LSSAGLSWPLLASPGLFWPHLEEPPARDLLLASLGLSWPFLFSPGLSWPLLAFLVLCLNTLGGGQQVQRGVGCAGSSGTAPRMQHCIQAQYPIAAGGAQFCLLCGQLEPFPRCLAARMSPPQSCGVGGSLLERSWRRPPPSPPSPNLRSRGASWLWGGGGGGGVCVWPQDAAGLNPVSRPL